MLLVVDYYFTYKNTLRYLLLYKLNIIKNTYNVPQIQKLILFSFFNKLEDLNNVELYNIHYLFKFFFGKNVFFTKTYSFYFLGKYYYNFNIQLILNKLINIYNILYYFKNNILLNIDDMFIKKGFFNNKLFYIKLKDIKIFSEIKTNLGLFYLKNPININIYLLGCNNINLNNNFILILKL